MMTMTMMLQIILRRQDASTRTEGRNGAYGLTLTGGRPCTVGRVKPGGVAFMAGLRSGDVICRVNGHCVVTASTDNVARILRYLSSRFCATRWRRRRRRNVSTKTNTRSVGG